jgi:hypothetical protein
MHSHGLEIIVSENNGYLFSSYDPPAVDIQSWMADLTKATRQRCSLCSTNTMMIHCFQYPLPFIALDIGHRNIQLNYEMSIEIIAQHISYKLCGIIYFKADNFTSRVIHNDLVWFHDGVITKETMICEGSVYDMQDMWNSCRGANAILAIYVRNNFSQAN